jgi:hypothetical protein
VRARRSGLSESKPEVAKVDELLNEYRFFASVGNDVQAKRALSDLNAFIGDQPLHHPRPPRRHPARQPPRSGLGITVRLPKVSIIRFSPSVRFQIVPRMTAASGMLGGVERVLLTAQNW